MSDLLHALNRLERAGSEESRCTKKLHEAACTVAEKICAAVYTARAVSVLLPRGYMVTNVKSNVGNTDFLVRKTGKIDDMSGEPELYWIDGQGSYLHGDFHAFVPDQTREGSLQFSKDIAEGLLDEIAEFLEKRSTESSQAAELLQNAD